MKRNKFVIFLDFLKYKNWIKNIFIFSIILVYKEFHQLNAIYPLLYVFVLMCISDSASYIINDIYDIENDRHHPKKKLRPIASGDISVKFGYIYAFITFGISLILSFLFNKVIFLFILSYFIIVYLYSHILKHTFFLDTFSIIIGFILRVAAGFVVLGKPVNYILVATIFFLTYILALGKRRNELLHLEEKATDHRPVLKHYNVNFVSFLIILLSILTQLCFFFVSKEIFSFNKILITQILIFAGLFRYNYIIFKTDESDPTTIILKDKSLKLCVLIFLLFMIIY